MNLYTKIKNKLSSIFNKNTRQLYIQFLKVTKRSDFKRWNKNESLLNSWNERTLMLSEEIQPNSIVFEFGAANLLLKNQLPKNCTYLHSDLVARNDETIVIDLNKELPELPISNYIVFSGVLEYVFDVKLILIHCSAFTDNILFSYATFDKFSNTKNRRFNGWVSDLSEKEIQKIANLIYFDLKIIGDWKEQTLYHLNKLKQ